MTDREENILNAALRVFSRYGVKRSSMADIAEEAGISRQTLYKAFRSKDDILRCHIQLYTDNAITEIRAGLANTEKLDAQLDLIFDKMIVTGFDLVRASPNAQDIEEGVSASSREALEETATRFQQIIEEVLSPHSAALDVAGLAPKPLAEFIQRSARATKNYAQDKDHLMTHLGTLRQLCLNVAKS